jgi:hypothetical protein
MLKNEGNMAENETKPTPEDATPDTLIYIVRGVPMEPGVRSDLKPK